MINVEVAGSNSFRDIKKNHFVTVATEAAAEADIDDGIKRKRFRVSLKNDRTLDQSWKLEMESHTYMMKKLAV